ncbi:hypothetical protein BC629DRAFT_1439930 [Irpex lacteus]|nr:hypothetical protein BC629DRAFT_1439930 [Irpex lacteus]
MSSYLLNFSRRAVECIARVITREGHKYTQLTLSFPNKSETLIVCCVYLPDRHFRINTLLAIDSETTGSGSLTRSMAPCEPHVVIGMDGVDSRMPPLWRTTTMRFHRHVKAQRTEAADDVEVQTSGSPTDEGRESEAGTAAASEEEFLLAGRGSREAASTDVSKRSKTLHTSALNACPLRISRFVFIGSHPYSSLLDCVGSCNVMMICALPIVH